MIKNIILDFGGILLDLDFERTDNRFKEMFEIDFKERKYPPAIEKCFIEYEIGSFDEKEFAGQLQKISGKKIGENDMLDAWNRMLVQIPIHRLEMLNELREKYNVFLLSNTNYSHIKWVHAYLIKTYGIDDFEDRYFDKVYYSHQMHKRKPNLDIYQEVLMDSSLKAEESLFVDDTNENIVAAVDAGLHAIRHEVQEDIAENIQGYISHVNNSSLA